MGTKNNPGRFDCYSNADPNEEMFHLLGRDRMAPSLVDLWALARASLGEDGAVVRDARDTASAMRNDLYLRRRKETPVLDHIPLAYLEAVVIRRRAALIAETTAVVAEARKANDEEGTGT